MKTVKYLIFVSITLVLSCNAQGKKESTKDKTLKLETFSDFIQEYLINEARKSDDNLKDKKPIIKIEDDFKEIDLYGVLTGPTYSIPLNHNEYIQGDINNDQINEIIVPVSHSYGASGGNVKYFLFTGNTKGYVFTKTFYSTDIANCKTGGAGGNFYITKIEDQRIIGKSICYTDSDARCCPSKQFMTTLGFNFKTSEFNLFSQVPNNQK